MSTSTAVLYGGAYAVLAVEVVALAAEVGAIGYYTYEYNYYSTEYIYATQQYHIAHGVEPSWAHSMAVSEFANYENSAPSFSQEYMQAAYDIYIGWWAG